MVEVDEPQFTSLSARIAALNQQGVGKSLNAQSTGKRPPPPPPPSNRPPLPTRNTTNNPPIATYGSSVTKQADNEPVSVKSQGFLPPPPIDRDQPKQIASKTPPLPARNGPPPLPNRKASQPSPALPLRKSSTQLAPSTRLVHKASNSSIISHSSTISGMSLGQGSSITSISSVDSQRKLPPALGEAKLPPLPPTRRELEEKAAAAKAAKIPLITTKSAPVIPICQPPVVERDLAPKMPPRPSAPPRLPERRTTNGLEREENLPAQPTRKLPPPAVAKSILSMGFGNKSNDAPIPASRPTQNMPNETPNLAPRPAPKQSNETPSPTPRPAPTYSRPSGPVVKELTSRNFDSAIEGKFALVDFYAPYCKYCKELDPIYKQLGEHFAFASDRLVIAKVDVNEYKDFLDKYDIQGYPTIIFFDGSGGEPETYQMMRQLDSLTEFLEDKTGIRVADGAQVPKPNVVPPPINMSSKPSLSQVRAIEARPAPMAPPTSACLLCRDFSGPDSVAAQYPRQSLPRGHDMTGYFADVLCGPFSSATDKARAIFTWLHHNIAYDTAAFFGNNIKHVDPKDTITSGLAVCGGYAGLFSAIALKAGLEAVMVTGHGKGYGYTALQPGDPIPPCNPSGHAWNAVRIDGGEWKLLDACWGAGNVGNQVYNKHFTPSNFTMFNDDFGIKHFPEDDKYFFRSDGRIPTWEEYMLGPNRAEPLQLFGSVEDHGLSATSFSPPQKRIPVNSREVVRFQFSKVCEHWDHEKNGKGKPYCMILKIWGLDGRNEDFVAFENNEFWWWVDVPATDLGAPGQTVTCYAVTTVNGKDVKGMTRREYLQKKGKCGMGFGGVCAWDLV